MGPYLYWKTAPQGPNRESDKKLGDRKDGKYMPFDVLLSNAIKFCSELRHINALRVTIIGRGNGRVS